jgi:hypothetical protein
VYISIELDIILLWSQKYLWIYDKLVHDDCSIKQFILIISLTSFSSGIMQS